MAFTHLLNQRQDSRVFLGQRVDEIVSTVLRAYPQANFKLELSPEALAAASVRGTTTQYCETDAAFVARLLSEEGWNWRLEHVDDGKPLSEAKAAKHCLVISDAQAQRLNMGSLRFGKPDVRQSFAKAGLPEDTITSVALERRVQPNAVTQAAWDARQLAGVSAELQSALAAGELPTLEIYNGRSERRFAQHAQGDDSALSPLADTRSALALARHELQFKHMRGDSAARRLTPGANFHLTEHSLYGSLPGRDDNQFVVLSVRHEAANNLGSEAAQLLQSTELEAGSYRNHFQAAPAAATLVPVAFAKPVAPGVQTALVVGHAGDTVTTERDLRVRTRVMATGKAEKLTFHNVNFEIKPTRWKDANGIHGYSLMPGPATVQTAREYATMGEREAERVEESGLSQMICGTSLVSVKQRNCPSTKNAMFNGYGAVIAEAPRQLPSS